MTDPTPTFQTITPAEAAAMIDHTPGDSTTADPREAARPVPDGPPVRCTVGPVKAVELLGIAKVPEAYLRPRLDKYAIVNLVTAIRLGEWQPSEHSPIMFTEDGQLLTGLRRLLAIILSGTTVDVYIQYVTRASIGRNNQRYAVYIDFDRPAKDAHLSRVAYWADVMRHTEFLADQLGADPDDPEPTIRATVPEGGIRSGQHRLLAMLEDDPDADTVVVDGTVRDGSHELDEPTPEPVHQYWMGRERVDLLREEIARDIAADRDGKQDHPDA